MSQVERYGSLWPDGWLPHHIELFLWKSYDAYIARKPNHEIPRWKHLKFAILLIDPEMRSGWNDWTEKMCWAYGSYPYVAALGCTASTKTHSFHKFAFYDYLADCLNTTMTCTTTNAAGLEQRMWPVISSTFSMLKKTGLINDWKMTVAPQRLVRPKDGETKHVIRAVTIDPKADKQKVVDQLIGVHSPRRIWLVDEATSAPTAVMDAWANAMAATTHKRFVMLGNPNDYADSLAEFCKPIGGWHTVNEDTETWEFEFYGEKGIGLHFHGAKSPNMRFPKNDKGRSKFHFMYDHDTFTAHQAIKESNPIQFFRMCVGWFMPEGFSKRVCSMAAIDRSKCKEHAIFSGGDIEMFASLDPAFGGDRCVLMIWKMGNSPEKNKTVMDCVAKYHIPIDPRGLPGEQAGKFTKEKCRQHAVKDIGIDTTTNNSSVAEWLTLHASELKVRWIPFGGSASDERTVSESDDRICKEAYFNKSAELAFGVANYIDSIHGVDQETCVELCSRYWEEVGEKPTRQRIETKDDYKDRMKKSPDNADCVAIGVEVFRQLGGTKVKKTEKKASSWNKVVKRFNALYSNERAYSE